MLACKSTTKSRTKQRLIKTGRVHTLCAAGECVTRAFLKMKVGLLDIALFFLALLHLIVQTGQGRI